MICYNKRSLIVIVFIKRVPGVSTIVVVLTLRIIRTSVHLYIIT